MGQEKRFQIFGHIVMTIVTLCAIIPLILLVISSFTDNAALVRNGYSFTPEKWSLEAYKYIFSSGNSVPHANLISWTSMQSIDGGISTNTIFRRIDNGEWEQIAEVGKYYNEYQDHLSNMIADETIYDGQFCYYVQIACQNGNTIRSNTACLQREPVIYIPNALNPKSDIIDNRTFRPRADFLADYHLAIYDKRGAIIFQSDDINEGWDGYDRSSKLCSRDTYMYHITYKTSSGKQMSKSGMVNLLY